ncbi:helix-turn-helix domain-containing protein [Mesorhizobium sp. M1300]|uniref:helix-turn-helix transcriptional regulator n=1 Tax=Mesorhizobium sp. M1300 TaxID=2957077 RepID=UPI00333B8487
MARTKKDHSQNALDQGRIETDEPGFERPVFRRLSTELCLSMKWKRRSASKRASREMHGLTREQLAAMLGLSTQVFRHYEVAVSRMQCETAGACV